MANEFKPNVGGKVTRTDAEKWIKKYDDERKDKEKDTKSIFYGKDFIMEILKNHPDAAGISFFFTKQYSEFAKKDVLGLVLIPRKEDGTLIYDSTTEGKDASTQNVYDKGNTCPPICS